jgi:hypothetical protein
MPETPREMMKRIGIEIRMEADSFLAERRELEIKSDNMDILRLKSAEIAQFVDRITIETDPHKQLILMEELKTSVPANVRAIQDAAAKLDELNLRSQLRLVKFEVGEPAFGCYTFI